MTDVRDKLDLAGTTALVTDIDRRKALPIIQSLGKAGVRVVGLSYRRRPMCAYSKYCAVTHECPDYRVDPEGFLQRLKSVCIDERPDVLYPLEDVVMELCLRNPTVWEPHTKALLPNLKAFELSRDKWQTMKLAAKIGIPTPKTVAPNSPQELDGCAAEWNGCAVIKPRSSSGSRGLRFVQDPADIPRVYQEIQETFGPAIIQERIPAAGEGLGVSVLMDRDYQPAAVFGHRRLREYPITGGPSCFCESYHDERLVEDTLKLLRDMQFVGVAMVEYKRDIRSGRPVLMEINPRFWGSLGLAICAGVNFPTLYHGLALGMVPPIQQAVKPNIRYRWLIGDVLHLLSQLKRGRFSMEMFRSSGMETCSDITFDDPWPLYGMIKEGLCRIITREGR